MQIQSYQFAQRNVRNLYLSGDQVSWSKDACPKQHEDTLHAWLSLDEVVSYEEDARLKTENPEEEDEECEDRGSGMSTAPVNKLQTLWDHFIHAKPQSYEVSINNLFHFILLVFFNIFLNFYHLLSLNVNRFDYHFIKKFIPMKITFYHMDTMRNGYYVARE